MKIENKKVIFGILISFLLLFLIIYIASKLQDNADRSSLENNYIVDENQENNDIEIDQGQEEENNEDEESKIEENSIEKVKDSVEVKSNPVPEKKVEKSPIYEKDSKEDLEQRLNEANKNNDYAAFADALAVVYKKGLEADENLVKIESEMYMKGTGYFESGEIDKAYEMADVIYSKVFSSWRFRYLKIRCLEKYGRDEFEKGNYDKAGEYAIKILQIQFRPEGANLLGDVYIKKIENNLSAGDKEAALNNLNYIWDYEVDETRRSRLTELKSEIEN